MSHFNPQYLIGAQILLPYVCPFLQTPSNIILYYQNIHPEKILCVVHTQPFKRFQILKVYSSEDCHCIILIHNKAGRSLSPKSNFKIWLGHLSIRAHYRLVLGMLLNNLIIWIILWQWNECIDRLLKQHQHGWTTPQVAQLRMTNSA